MHRVFVYGSLLSGLHNHRLLAGATPLGRAETGPADFLLLDLGGVPGAIGVAPEAGHRIRGEVYDVDGPTLDRLDALEGHPRFYRRERVALLMAAGGREEAWMYLLAAPGDYPARMYPRLPHGDWRAYLAAKEVA
jgi:gamma-glutamylaminecyclotransferase